MGKLRCLDLEIPLKWVFGIVNQCDHFKSYRTTFLYFQFLQLQLNHIQQIPIALGSDEKKIERENPNVTANAHQKSGKPTMNLLNVVININTGTLRIL